MAHFSTTLFSRNPKFLALTLSFIIHCLALQNPRDDFCRRYGHQSTVINDKLYIDGGWVNYNTFAQDHTDYSSELYILYILAVGFELTLDPRLLAVVP